MSDILYEDVPPLTPEHTFGDCCCLISEELLRLRYENRKQKVEIEYLKEKLNAIKNDMKVENSGIEKVAANDNAMLLCYCGDSYSSFNNYIYTEIT